VSVVPSEVRAKVAHADLRFLAVYRVRGDAGYPEEGSRRREGPKKSGK
jgi:hypothetical protein